MTDTVDVAVPVTDPGKQQLTTARDFWQRIARTLLQLISGGGLTLLIDQIVTDIPPQYVPYVIILSTLIVTAVQNGAEAAKPGLTIFKKPPVV